MIWLMAAKTSEAPRINMRMPKLNRKNSPDESKPAFKLPSLSSSFTLPESFKNLFQRNKKILPKKIISEIYPLDPTWKVIERYFVENPFSSAAIAVPTDGGSPIYYAVEEALDPLEEQAYLKLSSLVSHELKPPDTLNVDAARYVQEEAKRICSKYNKAFKGLSDFSLEKIFYYITRNIAGYGDLQVVMSDPYIEDISCNGIGKQIYIWHRKHESIATNIVYRDEAGYDNLVLKLAHVSGKHISSAFPILDAMLPEKHRLAATFMREVSAGGSTFCIRKFRPEPFSIVDLIRLGTIDTKLAAYCWFLLENKKSIMVVGETGAGKTSMLNALSGLINGNDKVITVEEVAELNLANENWVQLVSRQGFKFAASDTSVVTLFDLVKVSLRYRPDYIVVGEIRGEEAYVLFQAMATGHGGVCTMHGDSVDNSVKRLTSPPMNVSKDYIPLMNLCIVVGRVELPARREGMTFGRRIRAVSEILGSGRYFDVAEWDPLNDSYKTRIEDSELLQIVGSRLGMTREDIVQEIDRREDIISFLFRSNLNSQTDVSRTLVNYSQFRRRQKYSTASSPAEHVLRIK
jgi:flagellar protein FlaI